MAFFSSIFKKSKSSSNPMHVVGIDFGSSSVKVVELEQREGMVALKTYGELQLGPYAEQPLGTVASLDLKQRTEALVDVMRESKVTGESGVLAMPLSSSFVTIVPLKIGKDEDISARVPVEARKYIPVPISDISLDWTELPARSEDSETTTEVLLAAVQNSANKEMHQLLEAVDMASQPTEIEIFSTLRACTTNAEEVVAIIDLGAQTSKLYIAEAGMIRKLHRVFAGGSQVTQKLADTLDIPYEEAENKKRNYKQAGDQQATIKEVTVSVFERAFQEFKRACLQHETKTGVSIDRVIITGGSAAFPAMPAFAKYMLDRPIEQANGFEAVAYPAFMEDTLATIAPTFTVALGAALRSFDY